ncbi:MAG: MBL fold metallo-hydrolase [Anaerolineales bacterium]|nr:MBL fold metallo-hydrolase [Anaerolineales bacterium]
MPKLIILGTASAISDEGHENTHMVLVGEKDTVLIDCVSNPMVRLRQARVDFNDISHMILTHFHPDHVSGVPLLLMDMWLMGFRKNLNIYGLHHTLDRVEGVMGYYDWAHWPDFFPVAFHRLPHREKTPVLETEEFRIFASPVRHLIPTIGLRIESLRSGKVIAYSCDTEPCPAVIDMAAGADVLIHEAGGASPGHTSAGQAGGIAREAEAKSLYLIHYSPTASNLAQMVEQAAQIFQGPVALAQDLMELEF